jgi:hypothetical protein
MYPSTDRPHSWPIAAGAHANVHLSYHPRCVCIRVYFSRIILGRDRTRRRWLSVSANEHASVFGGADPMGKPARHRTPCPLHVARPNARS